MKKNSLLLYSAAATACRYIIGRLGTNCKMASDWIMEEERGEGGIGIRDGRRSVLI
jgi:hypothetical protein